MDGTGLFTCNCMCQMDWPPPVYDKGASQWNFILEGLCTHTLSPPHSATGPNLTLLSCTRLLLVCLLARWYIYLTAEQFAASSSDKMLCALCQNIDFASSTIQTESPPENRGWQQLLADSEKPSDSTGRFYTYKHHPSVRNLTLLARQGGCHLCAQVLWALEQVGLLADSPHEYHDGPIEWRWYPHPEKRRIEWDAAETEVFVMARTGLRDIKTAFTFVRFMRSDIDGQEDSQLLPAILETKASGSREIWSTGCRENFLLAGIWLRMCLTQHSLCVVSTIPSPILPTRVLDVGIRTGSGTAVRLVDGMDLCGPYAALSHVWGNARVMVTLSSNINERRNGIPLESLSRTFQDAVHVARQLCVPYLWIDSLCREYALTPSTNLHALD